MRDGGLNGGGGGPTPFIISPSFGATTTLPNRLLDATRGGAVSKRFSAAITLAIASKFLRKVQRRMGSQEKVLEGKMLEEFRKGLWRTMELESIEFPRRQ